MNNYYIGNYEYFITYYNGTYAVVGADEYERDYGDRAVKFVGKYEDCVKFRNKQEVEYQESLLF